MYFRDVHETGHVHLLIGHLYSFVKMIYLNKKFTHFSPSPTGPLPVLISLTYMQSTSCGMPGWMNSWNQDCWKNYHQPQICRWYHSNGRKQRESNLLMGVKEENEKAGLKLNIQKNKIIASSPITSWQRGEKWKQWQILFSWAPDSLQTVTAAMKLKDAYSSEGKLWPT